MGWTPSTRLRGSFARISDFARPRIEPALPSSRLAAAALIQSILLVALAAPLITGNQLTGGQVADTLALVALVTAGIGAYLVVRSDHNAAHKSSLTEEPVPAPLRTGPLLSRDRLISDAEQLTQLKARVSHELRTPLNAVIGFSELMQHEALGPVGNDRYREYAGHIRRSAEHFQWATERTLAVTEILASPRRPTRAQIPLAGVATEAFARASVGLTGTGSTEYSIEIGDHIEVEGCPDTLDHALEYLMSAAMAVAESQPGLGQIDIAAECHDCGQVAVHVQVPLTSRVGEEQAPGAELSLLLARLGLELMGGRLDVSADRNPGWQATARLMQARQRELSLD
jgi:signal transduction histidine kinase